jgi:predicted nucleic acid-binding protein
MVVVDTSVFSLFIRRNQQLDDAYLAMFHDLFEKDQIVLLGSVYQELLSGIRHQEQFDRLADILNGFDVVLATAADHQEAARFYNICRQNGIQGSAIDLLICAMAHRRNHQILTLDVDFALYAQYLPINLVQP